MVLFHALVLMMPTGTNSFQIEQLDGAVPA